MAYGHNEGCLVFCNLRSRKLEERLLKAGEKPIELGRMVGKPEHIWAMSSLMAACMAEVWKLGYTYCVTYADPLAGHTGAVYKAANWKNNGQSSKDGHPVILIDGKNTPPRTLYDKHGSQSIPFLKAIYGPRMETMSKLPKPRFYITPKSSQQSSPEPPE